MLIKDKRISDSRLNACRNCTYYVKATGTCGPLGLGKKIVYNQERMRLCGCIMKLKTRLRPSQCPIGRWPSLVTESDMRAAAKLVEQFGGRNKRLDHLTRKELNRVYEAVMGTKKPDTACAPCLVSMLKELEQAISSSSNG